MELVLAAQVKRHLKAIKTNPSGSYLFLGPEGVGKYTAAENLAQDICQHPTGVTIVAAEKISIGIAAIHELRQKLQLKGAQKGGSRVVIIRDGENMTREAQNALLKVLEEPPQYVTIIITAQHIDGLLPTVVSRCQRVQFSLPKTEAVVSAINSITNNEETAKRYVHLAQGRPGKALRLAQDRDYQQAALEQYRQVKAMLEGSLYQRLQVSQQVADRQAAQQLLVKLAETLRLRMHRSPKEAPLAAAQTRKLESLIRYLDANCNPKFVLDKACLELSS